MQDPEQCLTDNDDDDRAIKSEYETILHTSLWAFSRQESLSKKRDLGLPLFIEIQTAELSLFISVI